MTTTTETVHTVTQLDALPKGARLQFVGSGVRLEKTLCDLWIVQGAKGVWSAEEICMNRNPMEIIG